jgi:hypothetical protein
LAPSTASKADIPLSITDVRFTPKADMNQGGCDVRFVAKADISRLLDHLIGTQ